MTAVAGVDEVGVGALAGPVIAAAVILAPGTIIKGLADSKLLTAKRREALFAVIAECAVAIGLSLGGGGGRSDKRLLGGDGGSPVSGRGIADHVRSCSGRWEASYHGLPAFADARYRRRRSLRVDRGCIDRG